MRGRKVSTIPVTGLCTGLRRDFGGLPPPDPDRLRPLDRLCRELVLPVVLSVRRRGARLMDEAEAIPGYYAAVHRALTEPILLGGARRAVAIVDRRHRGGERARAPPRRSAADLARRRSRRRSAAKRDPALVAVVRPALGRLSSAHGRAEARPRRSHGKEVGEALRNAGGNRRYDHAIMPPPEPRPVRRRPQGRDSATRMDPATRSDSIPKKASTSRHPSKAALRTTP